MDQMPLRYALWGALLVMNGCLASGCSVFEKGSIVMDEQRTDVHLGRAIGVIISTETFVGLGFDEAHSDFEEHGSADFQLSPQYPPADESETEGGTVGDTAGGE